MSASDRDVQVTALLVIKHGGASAACYAAGHADELRDAGAVEGAKTWRRILVEIERLQALEPNTGARHRKGKAPPISQRGRFESMLDG